MWFWNSCEMMGWNSMGERRHTYQILVIWLKRECLVVCIFSLPRRSPWPLFISLLSLTADRILHGVPLFWRGTLWFRTSLKFTQPGNLTHLSICSGSPVSGALLKLVLNMKESPSTISDESISFPVILKMWMESSSDSVWEEDIHGQLLIRIDTFHQPFPEKPQFTLPVSISKSFKEILITA